MFAIYQCRFIGELWLATPQLTAVCRFSEGVRTGDYSHTNTLPHYRPESNENSRMSCTGYRGHPKFAFCELVDPDNH